MKRHILVTGGTGLVGSAIAKRLLSADCSLTIVSRRPPREGLDRVHWVGADLAADADAVFRKIPAVDAPAVDAVVHAAAAIHDAGSARSLDEMLNTNVRASDALFRWCGERAVKRLVLIGSLSVLRRPLQVPISESHPVGPASPYAMSKLWSEEQLFRRSRESGFTPVVLRISSPIPATFEALPSTVVKTWIQAALEGKPLRCFGTGSRSQDFVACDDVADAVLQSLESPSASGLYHIGSGCPLSMRDLAQTIAGFRNTPITFEGVDPNEDDRWELALDRARVELGYSPKWSGREAIASLARLVL